MAAGYNSTERYRESNGKFNDKSLDGEINKIPEYLQFFNGKYQGLVF